MKNLKTIIDYINKVVAHEPYNDNLILEYNAGDECDTFTINIVHQETQTYRWHLSEAGIISQLSILCIQQGPRHFNKLSFKVENWAEVIKQTPFNQNARLCFEDFSDWASTLQL
ncbi:hypothetical protein [Hymenobacter negativus]|uniref:Uncharacterized protein n=1 Tax=Hymenobacter negativus TaxID=2795026 RepID=A0ABS0Q252_9BACT|nr:hypothetical protein [Hymenobacter negativus]MBH8556723.1 hypothetical protein [Hymenobacter negativus]